MAVQSAIDEHHALGELLPIAGGGLLIVFAAWWIYFAVPIHAHLTSNRQALPWGYGHYLIFASAAAIGAGLEIAAEQATGEAHVAALGANAAVTVPAAGYLATVWLIHVRHDAAGAARRAIMPVAAIAVLACTYAGAAAVVLAGVVCAAGAALVTLTAPAEDASTADTPS